MKNRIIIIVDGGNIQEIIADKKQDILLVDWDKIKDGDFKDFDINQKFNVSTGSKNVNMVLKEVVDSVEKLQDEEEATQERFKKMGFSV